MNFSLCEIWPYLTGGLIGWLLAGLFAHRLKYIAPPVEGVVKKPIDKVVDNPEHLALIENLQRENDQLKKLKFKASSNLEPKDESAILKGETSSESSDSAPAAKKKQTKITPPILDIEAAKAAGFRVKQNNGQDNFTLIEGIGPKINELIHNDGIHTFSELALTHIDVIQKILDNAGSRYKLAKPGTWPAQSGMAASNKWDSLKTWQDNLDGGE